MRQIILSDKEVALYSDPADESYAEEKQTQAQQLANQTGEPVQIGHMQFELLAEIRPTQNQAKNQE